MEAVRRHRYVVNCRTVLGPRCAVCHRAGADDGAAPVQGYAARHCAPICPGLAIVHADLSLECSVPGCESGPSRHAWLARHGDVRSCSDLSTACALCSMAHDHD
jgi:hypothetical protein